MECLDAIDAILTLVGVLIYFLLGLGSGKLCAGHEKRNRVDIVDVLFWPILLLTYAFDDVI